MNGPFLEVRPVVVPPNALLLASPSKSETHRAILIGALTPHTVIDNPLVSEDTLASLRVAEAIGARTSAEPATDAGARLLASVGTGLRDVEALAPVDVPDVPSHWRAIPLSPLLEEGRVPRPLLAAQVRLHVERTDPRVRIRKARVDVLNSGTTLRIGSALAALGDAPLAFDGDESLRTRPMGPLLDALTTLGARTTSTGGRAPLSVHGPLRAGRVELPGDVSSQFVSALLIAAQRIAGTTEIALTTTARSAPYIRLTLRALEAFGGTVRMPGDAKRSGPRFVVDGPRELRPTRFVVPGDWSSAAFPLVAAALTGGDVMLAAMEREGPQGDRAILDVLEKTGCTVRWDTDPERPGRELLSVRGPRGPLRPFRHSFTDTPDLFPALAALAARCAGTCELVDAAHVRIKECDRVDAMSQALTQLGVAVAERHDALIVRGDPDLRLPPTRLETHGDHRILMALTVLGLVGPGPLWLTAPASYHVSYPRFRTDIDALGGETRVVDEAAATAADLTAGRGGPR